MAFNPLVTNSITINQEVIDYKGSERRRLCLQKQGDDQWEVQFSTPDERERLSYCQQYSGCRYLVSIIQDLFSGYSNNRVLMDMHMAVTEQSTHFFLREPRIKRIHLESSTGDAAREILHGILLFGKKTGLMAKPLRKSVRGEIRASHAEERPCSTTVNLQRPQV